MDSGSDPGIQPSAPTDKQKSVSYSQLSKYRFNDAVSQLGWQVRQQAEQKPPNPQLARDRQPCRQVFPKLIPHITPST
jgi:hypothetical protein